jgi:transcriptional regulator with XRE-family HTH domain
MTIDPNRLRELRMRKKLSRKDLANQSKISLRQITRLEDDSAPSGAVRERTVNQLVEALNTEPGVLSGELALPEKTASPR